MGNIRVALPAAMALTLLTVLAACGQGTTMSPSPSESPSAVAPSETPSQEPIPSDGASEEPMPSAEAPIEHPMPSVARVTEDGVAVRTEPSADAPVMTAEDLTGSGSTPEVVLDTDAMVLVLLGPVVADGESWYEVQAADGSELYFAFGWIPGRLIEPEAEAPGFTPIFAAHGQGEGAEVSTDVRVGSMVTVRVAATPMTDGDTCDIDVTLVQVDGSELEIASEEVTDVTIFTAGPTEMPELFQNAGGTVTLRVETECSFAATMIAP
jgi:hypothetical protein